MANDRRAEPIWDESRGMWVLRVQRNGTRKPFYSSVKGYKGRREVEAKADKWLRGGGAERRFSDAWEQFLAWQKSHNGIDYYKKLESIGRLYILPLNKMRKLSSVNPSHWQACIDAGAAAGLSRRSCENIRGVITSFLRHCRRERWEYVRLEDGDLVLPKDAAPAKEKRVLSPDNVRTLFTIDTITHYGKPKTAHWIHAWRFCVASGLRRGELAGLQWADISDGVAHVRRSINTSGVITHGKTDNARRRFQITPTMQKVLDDQAAYLHALGVESPWVFPDEYGDQPDPNMIYDRWRTYAAQHGIVSNIHELRHTFISINKSDMPLELLKLVVGHSKAMDTIGIYGHEVSGDQSRAASIMDETLLRYMQK